MTFDEFGAEIEKIKVLPNTAIKQLPMSLSEDTKKKLMKWQPDEAVKILINAIYEIDHGDVESIDSLVRNKL